MKYSEYEKLLKEDSSWEIYLREIAEANEEYRKIEEEITLQIYNLQGITTRAYNVCEDKIKQAKLKFETARKAFEEKHQIPRIFEEG